MNVSASINGGKICKMCFTTKELSEFAISRLNVDGRQTVCKKCSSEIAKIKNKN